MHIPKTPREIFLASRAVVGRPPLPEEQMGVKGPDPIDVGDWIREPLEDRIAPINLLDDYPVPVLDQGRTNRCGPFSGVSGLSILMQKTTGDHTPMSVNDLYRFCRRDLSVDEGVFMRDLMRGMAERGALPENMWPNHKRFDKVPDNMADTGAWEEMRFRIRGGYWRVRTGRDAAHILSGEQLPIWVGCTLYRDVVDSAVRDGVFRMPDKRRDVNIGGHAMLMVGLVYMGGRRYFILLNSWGPQSGRKGLFLMPEEYIEEQICPDMWTVAKNLF